MLSLQSNSLCILIDKYGFGNVVSATCKSNMLHIFTLLPAL